MDLDKEEKWLNEMSQKGWILNKKSFSYIFIKSEYADSIKIDYRSFNYKKDYLDYIALYEDSGWFHLLGSRYSGKQYFLRGKNASEDIFSDLKSKIGLKKRYLSMWITILCILIIMNMNSSIDYSDGIKGLYYTPGLWQAEGMSFIRAFLFETPLALMRFSLRYGIVFLGVLIVVYAYKLHKEMKLVKKNSISQ